MRALLIALRFHALREAPSNPEISQGGGSGGDFFEGELTSTQQWARGRRLLAPGAPISCSVFRTRKCVLVPLASLSPPQHWSHLAGLPKCGPIAEAFVAAFGEAGGAGVQRLRGRDCAGRGGARAQPGLGSPEQAWGRWRSSARQKEGIMLRIYQVVLGVLKQLQPALRRIEARDRDLARQLRRCSSSVALNLAEGMYSRGKNREARYHNALGSARESLACLEVARHRQDAQSV